MKGLGKKNYTSVFLATCNISSSPCMRVGNTFCSRYSSGDSAIMHRGYEGRGSLASMTPQVEG